VAETPSDLPHHANGCGPPTFPSAGRFAIKSLLPSTGLRTR